MRILSNGFPTNLPDSETISQGGPANFARLFINHIISSHLDHQWVGVVMERSQRAAGMKRVFASNYRRYFRLRVPAGALRGLTQAKRPDDPAVIFEAPIALLVELVRAEKPDVVFLNGFGILNWMLLKAAQETSTPVVIQHAGIWTKELEVHKHIYSVHGRRMMEEMEREATRTAVVEIFLNRWSHEYYRAHVAAGDRQRTEIVPLPFNFSMFRALSATEGKSRFGFERTKRHIGIIARWDDIKNHAVIAKLAKEAKHRGLPWKFHAVVEIPDHLKHDKAVRAYRRHVDIIKPLDRTGISDFCRSMDLLILPSLFDVSPTVVLEAMALDTPIAISPNVGYVKDFIDTGAGDWVVDASDPARATDSLERIMGRKMPAALRTRLIAIHDHRAVFAKYLDLFAGANVRGLPMGDVLRTLWKQEMQRFFAR